MGYRKPATKGDRIREHKSYIVSRVQGLDCKPALTSDLAAEFDVAPRYMRKFIMEWREDGSITEGIIHGKTMEADAPLVLQLHADGMTIREIAAKWSCSKDTVWRLLQRNGVGRKDFYAGEPVDKISLSQLQHCWADLQEPVYIDVGRVTRFYLVPVNVKESDDG